MTIFGNYISSIEEDKLKLEAQVEHLCSENHCIQKSLTEILQEVKINLVKTTTDKEFVHSQCNGKKKDCNLYINIDAQGEETDNKDGT